MKRGLSVVIGLLYAGIVAAVGLGEPIVRSSIDESLSADIPIILESGEVFAPDRAAVSLGTVNEFAQFNWMQSDYHQSIELSFEHDETLGHVIHLMTETPLYLSDIPLVVVLTSDHKRIVKAVRFLPNLGDGHPIVTPVVVEAESVNVKSMRDNETERKIQMLESALIEVRTAQDELIGDYQKLVSENEELKDILNTGDEALYQAAQKPAKATVAPTPVAQAVPQSAAVQGEGFSIQSLLPFLLVLLIVLMGIYKWQQSHPEEFEKHVARLKDKISRLSDKRKKD